MIISLRLPIAALAAAVTVIMQGFGGAAHAQTNSTAAVQKPFRLSFGTYIPHQTSVQDEFGNRIPSFGGTYEFSQTTGPSPTLVGIYLDYVNGSRRSDTFEVTQKYRHYAIGLSARELLSNSASGGAYIGIGAGYYNISITSAAVVPSTVSSGTVYEPVSNSYKQLGGKFFAGYELKVGLFAEADYTYIKKVEGTDVGGYEARIGIHF